MEKLQRKIEQVNIFIKLTIVVLLSGCTRGRITINPSVVFDNSQYKYSIDTIVIDSISGNENYMFNINEEGFLSIQGGEFDIDTVEDIRANYISFSTMMVNDFLGPEKCRNDFSEMIDYKNYLILHQRLECEPAQYQEFYTCVGVKGGAVCAVNKVFFTIDTTNHNLVDIYKLLDKIEIVNGD